MASGKHSYGYCDRTGFRYPLKDLVEEYRDGYPTGLRVGKDMLDEDHPQLRLGDVEASDDQTLENARPDPALSTTRALSAWNPVGGGVTEAGTRTLGLDVSAEVGRVSVG